MMERYSFRTERHRALIVVLLAVFLLSTGSLFAQDTGVPGGESDHKFVSLTHISAEKGKAFLTRLRIGTANPLPGTPGALLVTGEPEEVRKAVAVLHLVDAPEEFDVQELGLVSASRALPSNEQIAEAVRNLCIGTFAHPAPKGSKPQALIDVHNGAVVAIAPIFQLQDIKLAVELGPAVLRQQQTAVRQAQIARADGTVQSGAATAPTADRITSSQIQPQPGQGDARLDATPNPALRPAPAPFPELYPARADHLLGQFDTRIAKSSVPAGLPKVEPGAKAEPNETVEASETIEPSGKTEPNEAVEAAVETVAEPLPSERITLTPGQIIPSQEKETAELPTESVTVVAEPEATEVTEPVTSEPADTLSYEPGQFANGERTIDLALPEKLPVIQLLDLVGKYLNLSYIYDPAKVTGDVTLKLNGDLQGQMKVKDLYLLLESVLQFKSLVMTRHKGNIVKIVPVTEVMSVDPDLVTPDTPTVEAGDVVVTRVFELENIDTSSAENLLTGMGLTVGVTSIAESHTLIVTAYAHRMGRIERLLGMVDKPGKPREFRFRQLKYTMAKTLAEKVQALAEQLENVNVTVAEHSGSPATSYAKLPGETDTAHRTRVARLRVQEAQRKRAAAARGTSTAKSEEGKPGVYLDADERTNRILMIGMEEQMEVVDDLIDALDVEQQDLRSLELYRIRHVDAEEVAKKLQELGIISRLPETAMSSRITDGSKAASPRTAAARTAAAAAAQPAAMTATEVTEEGLVEEPQVVVVESTNSLLVNATGEQHTQIKTIISFVDTEMDEEEIPYKIYPLENSSPAHLAEVLESLIQETVEDKEGKIEKVIKKEEEITIVPDPNTYSLIVYASKKNQDWIANLVKQLDKRRPQVLIDVTLVEITETDAFTYDLNLIHSIPDLVATSGLTGVITEGKSTVGIMSQLDSSGRSQFADWQSNSGSLSAFYGDRHINMLLQAVQSKSYGRVLAKPKILVNDNEPGTIKTTDTTYVEKTSSIPVSSGGAGTDSTLIQTAKDYTPYEAGITLDITPHISEGDLLRLDIALVRSDFLELGGIGPPNTTASEVATAVTVPDGSTIILGGLLKLNQSKGGDKVPILGDLPLIGGLFRGINNSDRQSKLYVFVKAEIIRPAGQDQGMADLEAISERNRLAFEEHETKFQGYQDWPGLKPKPVEPIRVLEAQ